MKRKSLLNISPQEDQGSEAIYGFDYQSHCIARQCMEMVGSHEVTEIVCEFHEDFTKFLTTSPPCYCQVKKRESADTLTVAVFEKALLKLLKKVEYKDVGGLIIYGNGRPSTSGNHSLANLIALLDRPESERDEAWEEEISNFEEHFEELFPELEKTVIQKGIRLLKIYLTMPHPEAIVSDNYRLIADAIHQVWGVHVSFSVAQKAYDALYKRVWDATKKPKQPRSRKRIAVTHAREIIRAVLKEEKLLAEDTSIVLDTKGKLDTGGLKERKYLIYALQCRMDARQLKFELDLSSSDWQDYKDEIAVAWEEFQKLDAGIAGAKLWKELRSLLKRLGDEWFSKTKPYAVTSDFAEGVFFDMVAVCEAEFIAP